MKKLLLFLLVVLSLPAFLHAQPFQEIDPRSIWLNGTKTTTASIPFALGLSVPDSSYAYIGSSPGTNTLVSNQRGYLRVTDTVSDIGYWEGNREFYISTESVTALSGDGASPSTAFYYRAPTINILGGNATATSTVGGRVNIYGGSGTSGNSGGGQFDLRSGSGSGTSSGGVFLMASGSGGSTSGSGGNVTFSGGTGYSTGSGASISFTAGAKGSSGSGSAGSVILTGGQNLSGGGGAAGLVTLTGGSGNTGIANWGYVRIGDSGTPGNFNLNSSTSKGSLYVNQRLEVDSGAFFDSSITVVGTTTLATSLTGLAQLTAGVVSATSTPSVTSILVGNGTAAAPSIAFASDTNTGIYRTGADALGVSAGGVLQTTTSTIGLTIANTLNVNATSDFAQATRVDYNYGYALSNLSAGIPGGLIGDTGSSELMQFAINTSQAESSLAVFGYAVNTSTQGGLFRFDTRSGFPIFTIGFQDNQDNLGGGSGIQYAAIQLSGSQGRLGLGTGHAFDTDTYYGTVDISPKTNEVALYVRQEPAAGADITQWVNTAGAVRAYIDKSWNFSTTGDIFAGGSVTATTSVIGAKGYFNGNATNTLLVEQNGVRNNTLIVDTTNGTVGMLGAASTTVGVSIPQTTYGTSLGLTRTLSSKVNPAASFVINDTLSWTGASNYTHQLASLTLFDSRNVTSSAGVDTVSAMTMSYTSSATTVGATNNLRGISKIVNDTRTYNRSAGNTTVIAAADLLNASFSPIYNDGAAGRTLNYTGSASNMSMNVGGTLTSGTINSTLYGAYMAYGNSGPTVTSGTWNMILPAYYAGGSVTATGVNSSGYGFFYEMSGQDFDWGYFNNSANPNYMGKDNSKSWWGTNTNSGVLSATNQLTSGDASVYYDGTNFVINPKEVGTGLLQILGNLQLSNATPSITLTDSGGDDYIIDVGSTASLLRIRNTTDGTNAFQVDGNGNTAISTSYAPNANNKLLVQDRVTDPASVAKAAFGATMEVIVSSANWSGGNMRGFYGGVSWDGSTRDFNNGSVLLGLEGGVTTYSMVAGRTVRSQIGLFGTNSISGTGGTVTTATGISHYASVSGGVTVTTYNIFNPSTFAPSGGSTIGTLVGYRVPVQTGGTANFDMLFDTTAGAFWREAGNKIYSSAAATLDIDTTTTFNHRIGGTVKLALTSSTLTFSDAVNIAVNTTTGTKIGTATTQKLGFWNATPIVQPTTASGSATFVANAGTAVNDASTFDGYTLKQVVKALRDEGLLQ